METILVRETPKKTERAQPNAAKTRFLQLLYDLLETETHNTLIDWCPRGESIIIKDIDQFSEMVLPTVFNHKNFSSFVRQLHMYYFKKRKDNTYICSYVNPFFKRGRRDLLERVERRKAYKPITQPKTSVSDQNSYEQERIAELKEENDTLRFSESMLKEEIEESNRIIRKLQQQNIQMKNSIFLSQKQKIRPATDPRCHIFTNGNRIQNDSIPYHSDFLRREELSEIQNFHQQFTTDAPRQQADVNQNYTQQNPNVPNGTSRDPNFCDRILDLFDELYLRNERQPSQYEFPGDIRTSHLQTSHPHGRENYRVSEQSAIHSFPTSSPNRLAPKGNREPI